MDYFRELTGEHIDADESKRRTIFKACILTSLVTSNTCLSCYSCLGMTGKSSLLVAIISGIFILMYYKSPHEVVIEHKTNTFAYWTTLVLLVSVGLGIVVYTALNDKRDDWDCSFKGECPYE